MTPAHPVADEAQLTLDLDPQDWHTWILSLPVHPDSPTTLHTALAHGTAGQARPEPEVDA